MTAVEVEFVEEKIELAVGYLEAQSSNGPDELILGELATAVLVKFFEVGHEGHIVVVDKGHQPSEDILKGPVFRISCLESTLGDLELEESIEVVVPEVFDDVVLQMQLPVDILHLVDLQAQLILAECAAHGLICDVLQPAHHCRVDLPAHRVPSLLKNLVGEEAHFLLVFLSIGQLLFESALSFSPLTFEL